MLPRADITDIIVSEVGEGGGAIGASFYVDIAVLIHVRAVSIAGNQVDRVRPEFSELYLGF
jgi:cell division protein FtsW (lipid II flippase)